MAVCLQGLLQAGRRYEALWIVELQPGYLSMGPRALL